jgi:hypothetical protein
MSTNPIYGNQYFTNVRNLATAQVQRVKADEVNIGSVLALPVLTAVPATGVQGQVAVMRIAGVYSIRVWDLGAWNTL